MSQPESSSRVMTRYLFNIIMKGRWDVVVKIYKKDPDAQRVRITNSGYTALHMAVSDGREDIVAKLVHALKGGQRAKETLEGGRRASKEALEGGQGAKEALEGGQRAKEALEEGQRDEEALEVGQRAKEALEGGQGAKEALEEGQRDEEAPLAMQNDDGNTPLHIAASMGIETMCKLIARVDSALIGIKNKDGETPLFLAALHGKKDAFLCLHSFLPDDTEIPYRRRENGDTILHCAIFGEYFELAFKIIQLCKVLVNYVNGDGLTPLHVLANKPSAFESGSRLGRFQKIVYKILSVDKLKVDKTYEEEEPPKNEPNSSCPQNYQTSVNVTAWTKEELDDEEKGAHKDLVPQNYVTCSEFIKVVDKAMLVLIGPGYGGIPTYWMKKGSIHGHSRFWMNSF